MIRSIAADERRDPGEIVRPIERTRVLERIRTAARHPVAAIIAPAGFGKSVALRHYVGTVPGAIVCVVPTEAAGLRPFVRSFAAALGAAAPGLHRTLATALDGARTSDAPGRDLAGWAAVHLGALDRLIVIDDLHHALDDPEVPRFLTALIDLTAGGPRWLLASRIAGTLPLASWLAYGRCDLAVDAFDLRFTLDEAASCARAAHAPLSHEEVERIVGLVDGWPVAFAFALHTATRANDLHALASGTREMVYRYLAEQVWAALDGRTRAFLCATAFLPRLDEEIAVASGFDDAAAIIAGLRDRVAFVNPVGPGAYALHDLFRGFVQRQVQLRGDEALLAARVQAGRVLERAGAWGDALDRYIDARAVHDVTRVVRERTLALLDKGWFDVAERALRAIPSAVASGDARVLALRAALEESHGRVEQAERWYAAALALASSDTAFRATIAARYALLLYQQGRFDAIPIIEAQLADPALDVTDRAILDGILAMTYAYAGRDDDAQRTIAEAIALAANGDDRLRAHTCARAATTAFFASDGPAIEAHTHEAARLAVELGEFRAAARAYTTLTAYHAFAGRLTAAAWSAAQVVANAERAGDPQTRAHGLRTLLQVEAERGDGERVNEIARRLDTIAYRGPIARIAELFGRTLAYAGTARFDEACRLLAAPPDHELAPFQNRLRRALQAAVLARTGRRAEALAALDRYEAAVAHDTDARPFYARIRGIADRCAAIANILLERTVRAQRILRATRAHPGFEPFDAALNARITGRPEALAAALEAMRESGHAGTARFIDALLTAEATTETDSPEPLTRTELHVLRAVAAGLGNQAIADEQHRTINTVRTHVSSILRKLRCTSRGEAVAHARRRRLI